MTTEAKTLYQIGYEDGAEMARESGSADPGCEGWDGLLINAVGPTEAAKILGFAAPGVRGWDEALAEYCAGAQAGAEAAIAQA